MKRLIFICVALIAFLSTNASGTNYQPTDQLQTSYQALHPIVLLPALNVVDYTLSIPIVAVQPILTVGDQVQTIDKYVLPAYSNPEYGLCGLNGFNRYNYSADGLSTNKLQKMKFLTQKEIPKL